MVSTLNLDAKLNRVRRSFCFYLDIQDHGLARSLSRRIQDMGLQQEVFLTPQVSHVVRSGAAARAPAPPCRRAERRADAMLQRVRPEPAHTAHDANNTPKRYVELTVQKAISLLDKLYDTFFAAPRKPHVRYFTKHYIKIEFLDKLCRPIFKEFDEWPVISTEPDLYRDKKEKKETPENLVNINNISNTIGQKMTRKSRPRIKDGGGEKEQKGGYCEMCNTDYTDGRLHRRSPQHVAFVREHSNFLALDSLIEAGADVATFLDRANGERRSLRKLCNGDDSPLALAIARAHSPKRNGNIEDDRKHNTRCAKRNSDSQLSEDRQYYKVIGVSTKLRSSGGFATKKKESPPCNGTKPLVVKFRKIRKSELSVLSDEAEQFMFPKRASSTSSTSSEEEEKEVLRPKRKSPAQPPPPPPERRRQARPLALKEESSEEDSWPEDRRRRKRKAPPVAKRARKTTAKITAVETQEDKIPPKEEPPPEEPKPNGETEVCPLREVAVERCMKWEDGRLKYTPAVEQLEFAFETVPASEPWYETFRRQDRDKVVIRNIPQYFELYSKAAPKLPYEIGQLPPLKPNCCPLSDLLTKKDEKAGPSRSYGTRGMKKQRIRKRTAAVVALEAHPRKSPREHASTLAILGSAGLLNSRKNHDDDKSTASEDTVSDAHSGVKPERGIFEAREASSRLQEASSRLQQFLAEVFEDAAEYDMCDAAARGATALLAPGQPPDVSSLLSECDNCEIIRDEIRAGVEVRPRRRRGKFKKKNRTGWPNKRKPKTGSRTTSSETEAAADGSLDRSSAEPPDDEARSEDDAPLSEVDRAPGPENALEASRPDDTVSEDDDKTEERESCETTDEEKEVQIDVKVVVEEKDEKRLSRSSASDAEERDIRKKKRALQGLLLQPVVRVARVDPAAARRLRSGRARVAPARRS